MWLCWKTGFHSKREMRTRLSQTISFVYPQPCDKSLIAKACNIYMLNGVMLISNIHRLLIICYSNSSTHKLLKAILWLFDLIGLHFFFLSLVDFIMKKIMGLNPSNRTRFIRLHYSLNFHTNCLLVSLMCFFLLFATLY